MFASDSALILARLLESIDARGNRDFARTYARPYGCDGEPAIEIAGGWASYAGIDSPMTQAFGIAMREPVTSGDIDRLEEFYRSRGSAVNIEVCPYSDGSLLDAIGSRGYRAFEFSNVHVRQLSSDDCDNRSGRADITARSIDPGEEGIWCRTLVRGFLTGPEIRKEWLDLFAAYCAVEGVTCFLAELDREPIGGGLVLIRDGVAALAATSTLPNRRNLGAQTALLKARLAFAVERNCKLAMVTTMPGTTSERNVQRHGFRVVYTRCKFIREWGSRSPAE